MKKRVQVKFTFETDMAAGLPTLDVVQYVRQRLTDRHSLRPQVTVTEIRELEHKAWKDFHDRFAQTGESD